MTKNKKPTMTVKEAREIADSCAYLHRHNKLPRVLMMPLLVEALAVLRNQEKCITSQLNVTKTKLQDLTRKTREAEKV